MCNCIIFNTTRAEQLFHPVTAFIYIDKLSPLLHHTHGTYSSHIITKNDDGFFFPDGGAYESQSLVFFPSNP